MPARATSFTEHEPRSATARVLAPLALVGCVVALFLLISGSLADDQESSGGDGRDRPAAAQSQKEAQPESDTYTVVPGDTFSGIAAKTGVRLRRLERLNPDVDTATLNAGQQIKLR